MLALNCRSSSSSCPSPSLKMNSPSITDNWLLKIALSALPRPSSHSNAIVCWERSHQASRSGEPEKGVSCNSINSIHSDGTSTIQMQSSAELKKEISILEVEIMRLERYLLSLYRTAFEEHLPDLLNSPRTHFEHKQALPLQSVSSQSSYKLEPHLLRNDPVHHDITPLRHDQGSSDNKINSTLRATSTRDKKIVDTPRRSLTDHFITSGADDVLSSPGRLSEDIVRCIASVYCKLANPQQTHACLSASPVSSLSSSSIFSSQNPCDSSSPSSNEHMTLHLEHQDLKEESGPYSEMIEVLKICLDDDSFKFAASMLQDFRSLVWKLEKVDLRNMKREDKLAFWINIHNALVMHAHLAHGTHDCVKSTSILKAEYNVGGQSINAYTIQCSILGVRLHHPATLLQTLFYPGRKIKKGSVKHVYALDYPEHLVHFALCSGAYSDPAVRVYSAKSVFQDLKLARDEFIQANAYIRKGKKIFLPKILYYFAKDMSLSIPGLLEVIKGCLSEVEQQSISKCIKGTVDGYINWLPQSSTFRYVIHGELAATKFHV